MTIQNYLEKSEGIHTVGLYHKNGKTIDSDVSAVNITKYLDCEIDHVTFIQYEDSTQCPSMRIKACIHLSEE